MTAPLSIIITTKNSERHLPSLLNQLFDGMMEGLVAEIILADSGSTDTTTQIADESGAIIVASQTDTQSELLNRAAAHAKGQWLLCLEANSKLSEDWTEHVFNHMSEHGDFGATFSKPARTLLAKAIQALAKLGPASRSRHLQNGILIPTAQLRKTGGLVAHQKQDSLIISNLPQAPLRLKAVIEPQTG